MIYQYMDSKAAEYAPFEPQRARRLFALLQPHLQIQSHNIHIIGTNGKGSTGRFITQSILESGRTALHFTSPHILDFCERFFINGEIVGYESLLNAHEFLQQFEFMQEASYFEYATFLALTLGQECDFLVMEAGIGGEFDSTSVLHYDTTIITRIGLDHKEMLGESIEQIARTKLRGAQGNLFLHFQEPSVLNLLDRIHEIMPNPTPSNALPIKDITYLCESDMQESGLQEYARRYALPHFLQENLGLAALVLSHLGIPLLQSRLNLRARCELLTHNIILDVGHNVMAAQAALKAAKQQFGTKPLTLIYNSYQDKEIQKILTLFAAHIQEVIIFQVENPRIADSQMIENILREGAIPYRFFCPNARILDILPKKLIESSDILHEKNNYLVFGSFALVEQFLLWYAKKDK